MSLLSLAKRFYRTSTGRSKAFDLTEIARQALPNGTPVERRAWSATVHDLVRRGEEPRLALTFEAVGSAASSVPYFPGATELLIHNFLSHNYGLRDPILIQVLLVRVYSGVAARQLLIEPNGVVTIGDVDKFLGISDGEPGTLVVSAHHPRISIAAGQFRFIGLYRTPQGYAGCHSMPALFSELPRGRTYHRAVAPLAALEKAAIVASTLGADCISLNPGEVVSGSATGAPDFVRLMMRHSGHSAVGYLAVVDGGAPAALWHDGPSDHFIDDVIPSAAGTARCAVPLFEFGRFSAVAVLDARQIGFPIRSAKVDLIDHAGRTVASRILQNLPIPCSVVDLGQLFSGERDRIRHGHAVFDFGFDHSAVRPAPELMLGVYYTEGDRFLDQIHTTRSKSWRFEPNATGSFRCRKFGPLMQSNAKRTVISIQNIAPGGGAVDADFRVRVFTDANEEIVSKVRVQGERAVMLDLADLLPNDGLERNGVVWIEHTEVNVGAHWFVFDSDRDAFAADHFTGG